MTGNNPQQLFQQQQPGGLGQPGLAGLLGLSGGLLAGQPMGQAMAGALPGLLAGMGQGGGISPDQMAQLRGLLAQRPPPGGGGMMTARGWQPMPPPVPAGPQGVY